MSRYLQRCLTFLQLLALASALPVTYERIDLWFWELITTFWHLITDWLARPETQTLLIVWFITFWLVLFIPLILGFGPAGILAGSLAAGFQSLMYGGLTPAGGVFAVMTSIGMMGIFAPGFVLAAVVLATGVTLLLM